MRLPSLAPLTAVLALAFSLPALARDNYALLVGASEYTNLDKRFWLAGPANDIDLVRTYLTLNETVPFDPANITVLADGVAGGTPPTLAAIRTGMAALQARLKPGDFVYLHFSGHGTQAPAQDPDSELDGLDELFLPVDIGLWNDTTGAVENGLVDDEIGAMIAGLRGTGATVWAVFDSCHSGTVTRAAPGGDDVRLRKLDPTALGLAEARLDAARTPIQTRAVNPRAQDEPPVDTAASDGDGTFVAFYAAQSNEATPEKRLPKGKPGRRSQGVFTYTIFETLADHPGITYRQLGEEVLRRYATESRARATPMFVGDLDAPVFGASGAGRVRQWPLTGTGDTVAALSAGRLHGLDDGTRLAILASPADPDDAALGYVEVADPDMFTATLVPVAEAGKPAPALADLPPGAYARKLADTLDFSLTVAMPEAWSARIPASEKALTGALARALEDGLLPQRISFVDAGAPADLRLATLPGTDAIMVLPDSGLMESGTFFLSPRITTADKDIDDLAAVLSDTLARMARVQNLLKMGGSFPGSDLHVDVALQTRAPDAPRLRALDPVPVPRLIPEDEVHIVARNDEDVPVDLNVLYIGSDYSITHMFRGRLQPGDTLKQGLLRITDEAFGRDRVLLFMTPAQPHSAVEDFSFLAQDELPATRGTGGTSFAQSLVEAGFGSTTRAAAPLGAPADSGPRPAIVQFDIDTRPAN